MLRFLRILGLSLALTGLPAFVAAQTPQEAVIAQLDEQGFHDVQISRTLLGRIRIVAISETHRREIVINPVTGEILRDYWIDLNDGQQANPRIVSIGSGSGGSGSGGSGSGSGGSGSGGDDGGDDGTDDDHEDDDKEDDKEDDDSKDDDSNDDDSNDD